jgi:lipopolysaccharide biosynthesis protein
MTVPSKKTRLIAFYLPQFHPIPENDEWWGPGFTEWTNVAKARPLFRGHEQPKIPGELGFYDLRLPETRIAQARLAQEHGIEGFCYWHYWFAGRRIIERPFNEVLESRQPNFPFCLAWANETWSGIWHGRPKQILIEQTYPGESDYAAHFKAVLPALLDDRYIRVNGKPLFIVLRPDKLPDARLFTGVWRRLAEQAGLPGLHLLGCARGAEKTEEYGFDGQMSRGFPSATPTSALEQIILRKTGRTFQQLRTAAAFKLRLGNPGPRVVSYEKVFRDAYTGELNGDTYPVVYSCWDNTPRSARRGYVLRGSTPEHFANFLTQAIGQVESRPSEDRIVFIKSWNEWAEGNYLEPDVKWGRGYLNAVRQVVDQCSMISTPIPVRKPCAVAAVG